MSAFADYASQPILALDQGAALLAADEEPGLDPAAVLRALDELASSLHIPARSSPIEAVARLNHRLFAELAFAGDDEEYDHPDNSHLGRVLARRRGLPILLSVVYIEVARRHGVGIDGIGFPGHFIVSPRGVDPDAWARFTAAVDARHILYRMNNNLKAAWIRRGHLEGALRAVNRNLALCPADAAEHVDRERLLLALSRR